MKGNREETEHVLDITCRKCDSDKLNAHISKTPIGYATFILCADCGEPVFGLENRKEQIKDIIDIYLGKSKQ